MTSRFDNIPTAELVELERQCRDDRRDLLNLLRVRFPSEAEREIGKAYKIVSGRLEGRIIRLDAVLVGSPPPYVSRPHETVYPVAEGPLHNGKKWNIRREHVLLDRLSMEAVDV